MNHIVIRHIRRQERRRLIIRRTLRDGQNPLTGTSEQQFIDLYRFPKYLFLQLLDKIKNHFYLNERRNALPVHLRFLCALRFFATGSFQRTIEQDFMSRISQTSIHRCIHEVADILNLVWKNYVYFPNETEQEKIEEEFFEIASFPGIIGLMDATHIKIMTPSRETEHAYLCRKGGRSINLLLVCDSKYLIRYANAKFPGSSHDAYIWRQSMLQEFLKTKYEGGKRVFWLLGDNGFPLQPWLMTPFSSPSNSAEERYNVGHKTTRCMVKRCIGILKRRFCCISSGKILYYDPVKAGKIINACCVLHNILQKANVAVPNEDELEIDIESDETDSHDLPTASLETNNILREGKRVRRNIVETFF